MSDDRPTSDDKSGQPASSSDQDTPGRPTSGSSRQQVHPDQGVHSGSPEIDKKSQGNPRQHRDVRNEK